MSSAPMVEYNTAKALLDQMMNDINVIISKSLEGEDPDIEVLKEYADPDSQRYKNMVNEICYSLERWLAL